MMTRGWLLIYGSGQMSGCILKGEDMVQMFTSSTICILSNFCDAKRCQKLVKYCYTKLKCLKHKLSFLGINKDKTLKTTNNIIRENFQYNEFRMSPENTNLKTKLLFSVSFFVTFCLFCTNNKEMKHFNNNCKSHGEWKNE